MRSAIIYTTGFLLIAVLVFDKAEGKNTGRSVGDVFKFKGLPKVIHYTKNDYHSDSQFWTMAEDGEGVFYFGNNDGVVIYDSENWNFVKLPNGSTVRGLKYASDGNVYVGGYNDFGRIKRDERGRYYFESLTDLLRPEDRNFEDIWQIHETQGFVVFRSFKRLIAIINNKAITLPATQRFSYSNVIDGQLYVVEKAEGLKKLDLATLEFEDIVENSEFHNGEMAALLPGTTEDQVIAFTKQGNAYLINPKAKTCRLFQKLLSPEFSDQIFCAVKAKNEVYFLGTINSQIITLELNDNPTIEKKTYSQLQDNTVLNLFESRDGNIWALLNKGIDCIETSSPVSLIFENAAVYDALLKDNMFYLATNQGVYLTSLSGSGQYLSRSDFRIVEGLEAQAWSLWQYRGKVLVAHDRGVFVIDGNTHYHVKGTNGVWKVIPIKGKKDKYLACTYTGLYLLEYTRDKFVLSNKIEGFDISGRDIMQGAEPGVFWICHGYKGVYKIKIDEQYKRTVSLEHYTNQNGLPSQYNVNIFRWKQDTVFTTNRGIYRFHHENNQFVRHRPLTELLGSDLDTRKILQQDDKTWFVQDDELGYFFTDDPQPKFYKDLFLSLKGTFIKSMEYIWPVTENKVLVGTNDGLYLFNLSYKPGTAPIKTLITSVTHKDQTDSLIYNLLSPDNGEVLQLRPNTSSLKFSFAAPGFFAHTDIQYSFMLDKVDQSWSPWQTTSFKEYSYLKSGNYVFRVRARSLLGERSQETVYPFEILPVWYQTNLAKVVFGILAVIALMLVVVFVRKKIKKAREEEQKLRKVLELEIQQIKLEQEKQKIMKDKEQLEEDVIHKSKELANYTMLLVKKRELLAKVHEELRALKETVKTEKPKERIRALIKKIFLNLQDEEHLQVFDANFERVHYEFFSELKSSFPDLTQKELRLCGFVKMNLTNKEIASILNISVRGVETARYRLRKRMSIDQDVNMVEFLEKLSTATEESTLEEVDKAYFERG